MPDSGRFPDRDIERDLRDLGARIEYPPTPDLAHRVRHRIDEEGADQHAPRNGYWPSFLSPRWAAVAAAVVVVFVAALSPTLRTSLSDLFVSGGASNSGQQAGSGGSAARPESGGSRDTEEPVASGARASSAESSSAAATGCPTPSLEVEPARGATGATFWLHGNNFSTGCERLRPAKDIRVDFRQDGKTRRLATVDAGRDLTFDVKLHVPAGARFGQATVRATTRSGELFEEHFVVLR